ncbi:hypothetical protein [Sphingomonas oligophenolica]|uniref:Uncharacterized protein n=1 Tax=Sphingomonas oligophenolica TaxID=301154 RepID=A0A502CCV6_9SPHN|nr:hypothetical protein [Sphingomonas oligophenolica]TPG09616.1 hypothetical protein EAH84_13540 [Sphingomonas oligophenolica]
MIRSADASPTWGSAKSDETRLRIDLATVIGFGLLLMPLSTMWHEIGGHAATCVALGGRVTELGAFYVECMTLGRGGNIAVALAGATMDAIGAAVAFQLWRRMRGDLARLAWWYVWLSHAMTAAGYLCFRGRSGLATWGRAGTAGSGRCRCRWRGAQANSSSGWRFISGWCARASRH